MDDADNHETECALRETEEEIGLRSEFVDVRVFISLQNDVDDFTLDLGRRIANHSRERAFNCSCDRSSSQLLTFNVYQKPRRGRENICDFTG